jgi:hypothetical protein
MEALKVGQSVVVARGGLVMKIEDIFKDGDSIKKAKCVWRDEKGRTQRDTFPIRMLEPEES